MKLGRPHPRVKGRTARLAAALAILLVPAAAQFTATAPAAYAVNTAKGTPGFCPDANGVTVIIDFQELGGTTIVRCAPGAQATGHAALKNAGIDIAGTTRWGEAFICRIEGKPGPNSEPCIDTPPASAYWSYWHAPNNGTWTYSQWGVMNRKPPLGSFEGWSFSKDKTETTNPPPRVGPVRPAAPPPPPPTQQQQPKQEAPKQEAPKPEAPKAAAPQAEPPKASKPTPGGPAGGGTGPTGTSGTSATSGATAAGSTATPGDTAPDPLAPGPGVAGNPMEGATGTPDAATTDPASTPQPSAAAVDPASAAPAVAPSGTTPGGATWTGGEELARDKRDSGIPATTLAGLGLLAALCAGAAFTVVRRRRAAGGAA